MLYHHIVAQCCKIITVVIGVCVCVCVCVSSITSWWRCGDVARTRCAHCALPCASGLCEEWRCGGSAAPVHPGKKPAENRETPETR